MQTLSFLSAIALKFRPVPVLNTGVRVMNLEDLCEASAAAEVAWSNELRRLWRSRAGGLRFDEGAISDPRLRKLHDSFRSVQAAYMDALATDPGSMLRTPTQSEVSGAA